MVDTDARDSGSIDRKVAEEQASWASPDSLEFYSRHRSSEDQLYESERFFLPAIAREVETVLDIGCAAGGFFPIMRAFNPEIQYTGIDVTEAFIDLARARYDDAEFFVSDGLSTPLGSGSVVNTLAGSPASIQGLCSEADTHICSEGFQRPARLFR